MARKRLKNDPTLSAEFKELTVMSCQRRLRPVAVIFARVSMLTS